MVKCDTPLVVNVYIEEVSLPCAIRAMRRTRTPASREGKAARICGAFWHVRIRALKSVSGGRHARPDQVRQTELMACPIGKDPRRETRRLIGFRDAERQKDSIEMGRSRSYDRAA